MASRRYIPATLGALAALLLAACAGNKPAPDQIFLMPAPDVYEEGEIDPFIDNDPISRGLPPGILYATDRAPAAPDDRKYENYTHERGFVLRVGRADTRLGHDETITWDEVWERWRARGPMNQQFVESVRRSRFQVEDLLAA